MTKVLITGANTGIGLATTLKFLENGFHVIALDKRIDNPLLQADSRITFVEFDLQNIRDITGLVEGIGTIDVLVNNAGIINSMTYDEYDEEAKRQIIAINLEAQVEMITRIAPSMITRHSGRIVNISSVNGKIGHSDIWYGITKAGIINMTKSFSKVLGSHGVLVNCVAPGPVDTAMLKRAPQDRVKTFVDMSIEKRAANPDEIAEVIYWLGTTSPAYMNGSVVDVNNGIRL